MKSMKRFSCLLFAVIAAALLFALPAGAQSGDGNVTYRYSESLAKPQNLKAVPYGLNGIRLSWTASAGATHYIVYRFNFKADEWEEIGKAYKAAFYDGGLSGGTTYYYMIAAAAGTGDSVYVSAYTDYVGAKTDGAPVAPQNVEAVAYGQNGIRLSWDVSSGSTQYNVYRYNGEKKEYVYIGTAYKPAYYDGSCAPSVTYYYKVRAIREAEDATYVSGLSASVSATAFGAPAVPQNVNAAAYGDHGIRLSWTASSGATQYNVYRYNGEKKDYVYIGTAYKAAYYDGSCAPGVTYYYKVRAIYKTDGDFFVSGLSASVSATAVGAPIAPQNVKAAGYGERGIRLTWTASPGATQYNVYRYNGEKQDYVYIGTTYKAAYYDGSRVPGVTYYYKVRAIRKTDDATKVSGLSASACEVVMGAPVAPQNVKAAAYNSTGIRLTWTASPGATLYNVYRYNGAQEAYVYIGTAYKAAYYDGTCAPGVTYYYKVTAVYATDAHEFESGGSASASARFVGAPAVPKNLSAALYGDAGIRLSWTASPGATAYYVYRYNGAKNTYVYIGSATKAAYYDGSLSGGVTYYYRVRAVYKTSSSTYVSDLSAADSATVTAAQKAKRLVGKWLNDPWQFDELTITAAGNGVYYADLYFYRTTVFENCYGTANPDGSISFWGYNYDDDWYIEFCVQAYKTDRLKLTVLSTTYEFKGLYYGEYSFMRPGAKPTWTIDIIWDQLMGYYWLQKPADGYYGDNMGLEFEENNYYYEFGKYMFGYGLWNSETVYECYVDESTITGDLNGVVSFYVDKIYPNIFADYTYGGRVKVSFDFSNRNSGKIRYKYGSGNWETFAYRYSQQYWD